MTSTDCFFLALEKHGDFQGASGSVCRYLLEFDDALPRARLQSKLEGSKVLQYLLSMTVQRDSWLNIPYWKSTVKDHQIIINECTSDDLIPDAVLARRIDFEKSERIIFDLIHRSNGKTTLILAWHHLLMDGRGAVLLLNEINSEQNDQEFLPVVPKRIRYTPLFFLKTVKMFMYYTALFWTPLIQKFRSDMRPTEQVKELRQQIKYIAFNEIETHRIETSSANYGSTLGMSSYLLACTAMVIKTLLERQGRSIREFWVPVPQDQRKKGATGPIIGNHLSFLFYTMKSKAMTDLNTLVCSIQNQMKNQIKRDQPMVYDALMRGFRRLPTDLYYQLVKGSKGRSLASFLFTMAATHPDELNTFLGLNVTRVFSLPPNTYPPGCTVAFMKHEGKLQIMLLYYEDIWSSKEVTVFEKLIKDSLLGL